MTSTILHWVLSVFMVQLVQGESLSARSDSQSIDGTVSPFGLDSTVHIVVDVLPIPQFKWFTYVYSLYRLWYLTLRLTSKATRNYGPPSLLTQTSLVGAVSFTELSDLDFIFDALFEHHTLG